MEQKMTMKIVGIFLILTTLSNPLLAGGGGSSNSGAQPTNGPTTIAVMKQLIVTPTTLSNTPSSLPGDLPAPPSTSGVSIPLSH